MMVMKKNLKLIVVGFLLWLVIYSAAFAAVDKKLFIDYNIENLQKIREQYNSGKLPELKPDIDLLLNRAEKRINFPSMSVTDKTKFQQGAQRNDYISLYPYYQDDGTMTDGIHNPRTTDQSQYDNARLMKFSDTVADLCLAYYFCGKEAYARSAARLIHAWFIDKETRMNPNANFAQVRPGGLKGRFGGMLDYTCPLIYVIDSAQMLEGSSSWTREDQAALQAWFKELTHWMLTSPFGKLEAATTKNNVTIYNLQVSVYATYCGQGNLVPKFIEKFKDKISSQIAADGTMPLELVRTRSKNYTLKNFDAMVCLAQVADYYGIDLLSYRGKQGQGILKSADFLAPFIGGAKWIDPKDISEEVGFGWYNHGIIGINLAYIASRTHTDKYNDSILHGAVWSGIDPAFYIQYLSFLDEPLFSQALKIRGQSLKNN